MMLVTVLLLLAAGWPLCGALDPEARGGRRAGESLLLGSASAVIVLQILAICGIRWDRVALVVPVAAISVVAGIVARRRKLAITDAPAPTGSRLWYLLDGVTLTLVAAHLLFSSLERPYEWDYFGIWGFKGSLFYASRSIPWPTLSDPAFRWIQQGHPLFTPILYDVVAIVAGRWNDARLGLLATAFGASLILIVRGLVAEEDGSRFRRSAITLAVTPAALSMWIGLAEPFLVAFATAGILLIRHALRDDRSRSLTVGAVCLGCAVMTKNEGLAFLAATVVGVLVATRGRWRTVIDLWPAAAVATPWLIIRQRAAVNTGLFAGEIGQRIERIAHPAGIVKTFFATPVPDHVFWWAAIAAIALCFRHAWTRERFLVAVIAFQFACYVGQNFLVPWSVESQIMFSWNRILDQLAPATAFTAAILLSSRMEGREVKTPSTITA
jgi:hypothetical protein